MKKISQIGIIMVVLLLAAAACNLPGQQGGGIAPTTLPAPDQTLTALFAAPTPGTAPEALQTPSLPPVEAATQPATQTPSAAATFTALPATATNVPIVVATATQPAAAATATIPGLRPRAAVVAKFLSTPPTLDGDWSEWKDLTTEYPANSVVWGNTNRKNDDDLSASFHVGWDANNLYIAVKVRDDKYVQNATGANMFKGDSIEVLLDTQLQTDYYYNVLSPDDYQLGISAGSPDVNANPQAYLWFPANLAGSRPKVKIAATPENGVYRVEAAIPWSTFSVTPAAGTHYGFALSVSDNDDPNSSTQQSMVSNDAARVLADPTTWGDLYLSK